jgi:phage repressor protein C with HTH and peptisase S24 domain
MSIADTVRQAREAKGWTQAQLADAVGISQQAIGLIESGRTKTPTSSWRRIAAALEIPENEMEALINEARTRPRPAYGHLSLASDSSSRLPRANVGRMVGLAHQDHGNKTIPVLGHAAGAAPGRGYIIMGDVIERVACPPWLESVEGAYALYVDGTSMVPRYYPGERVYVHPHKPPSPGDFVVAQVQARDDAEPHGYVKQFKGWDGDLLVLHQFNPDSPVEFSAKDVLALHKIVVPGLT